MYFSGKEDKHEQGMGFLVDKDIVTSVIGCRQIFREQGWLTVPAATSSYVDTKADAFCREFQSLVDQTPKQDILVVQWDAKVGQDGQKD